MIKDTVQAEVISDGLLHPDFVNILSLRPDLQDSITQSFPNGWRNERCGLVGVRKDQILIRRSLIIAVIGKPEHGTSRRKMVRHPDPRLQLISVHQEAVDIIAKPQRKGESINGPLVL